jgi:adenine specific DNA methylase Mod
MGMLYYGDNLDILRRYLKEETVDLVYLDPPFNSAQNYNAFLQEKDGTAASQIRAFEDTWHWDLETAAAYRLFTDVADERTRKVMQAFYEFLGGNDMMAYLTMMAPRLVELRRVLKPSGSLYLHCDPTASHYLKLLLDGVFGAQSFRNEIIWKRTTSKSLAFRNLPSNHDVLLLHSKGDGFAWNPPIKPYDLNNLDEKTAKKYCYKDADGRRYTLGDLTNPNPDRPNLTYEFLSHRKVWRWTRERMEEAYKAGIVLQPSPGAVPRLKRYLDDQEGKPYDDVWTDIPPINSQAQERLGYGSLDFAPTADRSDGGRDCQRRFLRAQAQQAHLPAPTSAHGKRVDGGQRHRAPFEHRCRGRDLQESPEGQRQRPRAASILPLSREP